jgi:putative hydrolase of the HAD superfamily
MLRAILLDAGLTLVYPSSGDWFVPPGWREWFEERVDARFDAAAIDGSFKAAYDYLDANHLVPDLRAERSQFERFFELWLGALGVGSSADYAAMAESIVFDAGKFSVYGEVRGALARLSARYALAIVSDTWPSLDSGFRAHGLRDFFKGFVMSSSLGVCKPDPRMYLEALSALGVDAGEALFVDDSRACLDGAAALGIACVRIDRSGKAGADSAYPVIRDLTELERALAEGSLP